MFASSTAGHTDMEHTTPPPPPPAAHRHISIDGGGVKGIVPCILLREVQLRSRVSDVRQLADSWSGTSIGGLLCLALNYGVPTTPADTDDNEPSTATPAFRYSFETPIDAGRFLFTEAGSLFRQLLDVDTFASNFQAEGMARFAHRKWVLGHEPTARDYAHMVASVAYYAPWAATGATGNWLGSTLLPDKLTSWWSSTRVGRTVTAYTPMEWETGVEQDMAMIDNLALYDKSDGEAYVRDLLADQFPDGGCIATASSVYITVLDATDMNTHLLEFVGSRQERKKGGDGPGYDDQGYLQLNQTKYIRVAAQATSAAYPFIPAVTMRCGCADQSCVDDQPCPCNDDDRRLPTDKRAWEVHDRTVIPNGHKLIDGGFFANNPVLPAFARVEHALDSASSSSTATTSSSSSSSSATVAETVEEGEETEDGQQRRTPSPTPMVVLSIGCGVDRSLGAKLSNMLNTMMEARESWRTVRELGRHVGTPADQGPPNPERSIQRMRLHPEWDRLIDMLVDGPPSHTASGDVAASSADGDGDGATDDGHGQGGARAGDSDEDQDAEQVQVRNRRVWARWTQAVWHAAQQAGLTEKEEVAHRLRAQLPSGFTDNQAQMRLLALLTVAYLEVHHRRRATQEQAAGSFIMDDVGVVAALLAESVPRGGMDQVEDTEDTEEHEHDGDGEKKQEDPFVALVRTEVLAMVDCGDQEWWDAVDETVQSALTPM